jgi:hypothetical protein
MIGLLLTLVLAALTVATCVSIHSRGLYWLSRFVDPKNPRIERFTLGVLVLHLVEVVIFAAMLMFSAEVPELGSLRGLTQATFEDYAYFSIVCYTTLGFGEIVPTDHLRLLSGIEGVTGLVLITWSASFGFIKLEGQLRTDSDN